LCSFFLSEMINIKQTKADQQYQDHDFWLHKSKCIKNLISQTSHIILGDITSFTNANIGSIPTMESLNVQEQTQYIYKDNKI